MKLGIPFTDGYSACVRMCQGGKAPDWTTHPEGWSPYRKWYDITMTSSMDQWEKGIPWKYPCRGRKGGSE